MSLVLFLDDWPKTKIGLKLDEIAGQDSEFKRALDNCRVVFEEQEAGVYYFKGLWSDSRVYENECVSLPIQSLHWELIVYNRGDKITNPIPIDNLEDGQEEIMASWLKVIDRCAEKNLGVGFPKDSSVSCAQKGQEAVRYVLVDSNKVDSAPEEGSPDELMRVAEKTPALSLILTPLSQAEINKHTKS